MKKALAKGTQTYVLTLEAMLGKPIPNSAIKTTFLANDAKAVLAANSGEWFDFHDFIQYVKAPALIYAGSEEPSIPELQNLVKQLNQSSGYHALLHIFPHATHAEVYWNGKTAAPVIRTFIKNLQKASCII